MIDMTLGELLGIVPVIEDWKPDEDDDVDPISISEPVSVAPEAIPQEEAEPGQSPGASHSAALSAGAPTRTRTIRVDDLNSWLDQRDDSVIASGCDSGNPCSGLSHD